MFLMRYESSGILNHLPIIFKVLQKIFKINHNILFFLRYFYFSNGSFKQQFDNDLPLCLWLQELVDAIDDPAEQTSIQPLGQGVTAVTCTLNCTLLTYLLT